MYISSGRAQLAGVDGILVAGQGLTTGYLTVQITCKANPTR